MRWSAALGAAAPGSSLAGLSQAAPTGAPAHRPGDAGVPGERIRIFAKEPVAGGSLDGAGGAGSRYMVRGGRMFEEHFVCTFDLLSSIPSIDNEGLNLKSKRRSNSSTKR
jgi:myosin-crossreactive antigen